MALLVACLMAGLSFLINQALLRLVGNQAVISYGPAAEEILKTLPAYYLGVNLLAAHVLFGLLEALYDWYQQSQRMRGLIAALSSTIGHSLFGMITVGGFYWTGSIWVGLAGAIIGHLLWNVSVIRMSE